MIMMVKLWYYWCIINKYVKLSFIPTQMKQQFNWWVEEALWKETMKTLISRNVISPIGKSGLAGMVK